MLTITTISGNIFHDKQYKSQKIEEFEKLKVSRIELEKNRMRKQTNKGTDVGLVLASGKILHHGDVLADNEKIIIVEQLPEKVIAVKVKNKSMSEILVLIGHIIGNRHRPISIKDDVIYFPIQAYSELEVFEKLFAGVKDDVKLSIDEIIFQPHNGANVHDHG